MIYLSIIVLLLLLGYSILKSIERSSLSNASGFVNIDSAEAKEMMNSDNIKIIDVRTSIETSAGVISNALHIDVNSVSFKNEINKLDKDQAYLVYCRSGRRSMHACRIMIGQGFNKLYNLAGGYNAWK